MRTRELNELDEATARCLADAGYFIRRAGDDDDRTETLFSLRRARTLLLNTLELVEFEIRETEEEAQKRDG